MTMQVATRREVDGTLVAVKTAAGTADADRLAHEADVLEAARHPGVVAVREFVRTGDTAELVTAHAGDHNLANVGQLRVDHVAGVVAAVASTVGDLHALGVAHGRLDATHVVLGRDGRPVLCGFSGGGPIGTEPPAPARSSPWVDPPRRAALDPADDVRDLGLLLRALLAGERDDGEPIPDRRGWPRRRSWAGYHPRSLLTLADQASADDTSRRPTAKALADAILEAVPDAALPTPSDPVALPLLGTATSPSRPRIAVSPARPAHAAHATLDDRAGRGHPTDDDGASHASRRIAVAATVALLVIAIGALQLIRAGRAPAVTALAAAPTTSPRSSASTITEPPPSTTPAPTCPSIDDPTAVAADVDGDGCPDAVHVTNGVVEVDGVRWAVGQPGDELLVGDWDCDGIATVAVVRPTTGEVFMFSGWSDATSDLVATPVPDVTDARSARATATGSKTCPALLVTRASGATIEVKS